MKVYKREDGKEIPENWIKYLKKMREKETFISLPYDLEEAVNAIKNYSLKTIFLAVEMLKPELMGRKKFMIIERKKSSFSFKTKNGRAFF